MAAISGSNFGEQAEFVEKFEGTAGGAFGEQLGEFFADALGGDNTDFAGVFADGGEGCGFDGVAEARGEADGAEHAEFVFGETAGRLADGANDSGGEIVAAADEVEDFAGVVAHEQAVDGEIAALDVFFGRLGIDDLVGMAAIGVTEVGAEGGDFDFERNRRGQGLRRIARRRRGRGGRVAELLAGVASVATS